MTTLTERVDKLAEQYMAEHPGAKLSDAFYHAYEEVFPTPGAKPKAEPKAKPVEVVAPVAETRAQRIQRIAEANMSLGYAEAMKKAESFVAQQETAETFAQWGKDAVAAQDAAYAEREAIHAAAKTGTVAEGWNALGMPANEAERQAAIKAQEQADEAEAAAEAQTRAEWQRQGEAEASAKAMQAAIGRDSGRNGRGL